MINQVPFDINCENLRIENYNKFLSKFDEWSKFKREINLNFLLNSQTKLEFEVELDNSSSVYYVGFYENPLFTNTVLLQKSAAIISSLKFILAKNSIESLVVNLNILSTTWGKTLKEMIESENKPDLLQQIVDGELVNFYFLVNKNIS